MTQSRGRSRKQRIVQVLAVALAGGLLPISCQTRFRDAVVAGTKNYVSTLLDPSLYISDLFALPPTQP